MREYSNAGSADAAAYLELLEEGDLGVFKAAGAKLLYNRFQHNSRTLVARRVRLDILDDQRQGEGRPTSHPDPFIRHHLLAIFLPIIRLDPQRTHGPQPQVAS